MKSTRLLASLTICVAGAAFSAADDWPDWRGPAHNGHSYETGLVESWDYDSGENVLWESPIGGRAAPVVLNGRVFLGCRTADDVTIPAERINAREQVVCRDAANGEIIWQDVFNITQTDIPAPRVGWAALVADPETSYVYMHSVSGIFRCYDFDGNVVWEKSLLEEYGKISGYGGRTQTPIIDEDKVIVGFFGLSWGSKAVPPPKMTYFAFDKRTGALLWQAPVGSPPKDTNYSNPVVTVIDGQRLLIGGGADGNVHAINVRNGAPVWTFRMSRRGLNMTPAVVDNYVYISHGEDNIDTTEFGRVQCIDARGKGDITETNSVWRVNGIKAGYSAMLVNEGILYVVADTGKLHAFDSQTGEELWDYSLGTVGKGAPVWADGKMYVMEVNGRIHILKPTREKCESLSMNHLKSVDGKGDDEIYATPAISDGRVFFVTRDRTICIGNESAGKRTSHDIPALAAEKDGGTEIASIRVVPSETRVASGESITYKVEGLNALGQTVGDAEVEWTLPDNAVGVSIDGNTVTVAADAPSQGIEITATSGDMTSLTRLRNFAPLPWSWDFEGYAPKQVPSSWVNAFLKLQPTEVDGGIAMKKSPQGRPSWNAWLGTAEMEGYTVQADVMLKEDRRKLPSAGLVVRGYNLILVGNTSKLELNCWAPHKRIDVTKKFRSDPDVWYTMKMTVEKTDDGARVLGKVWKRGDAEPEEWTIEATDPHPAESGGPGLFTYSLADVYFDNVSVTE
jgi:outer membrane protein assembly factor BamB